MLVGFPANLRNMHEISNAVASFGRFIVWDRVKTTDAAVVIKVRLNMLQDIPASIVVSDALQNMSHSWTCPLVIFQNQAKGGSMNEQDTIPEDGNPDLWRFIITLTMTIWLLGLLHSILCHRMQKHTICKMLRMPLIIIGNRGKTRE